MRQKGIPSCEGVCDINGIGNRIRIARKAFSTDSQSDLAEYLDVGRRTIMNYESGTVQIPIDKLIRIGQKYDISILWLLGVETTEDKT